MKAALELNPKASPLPNGWRWIRLGDACHLNPRRPEIARADGAPTTFIPMAAVAEEGRGIKAPELRPYDEIRKGYTFFAEGDVLFAKITPCLQNGKHAVAQGLKDGIGFGTTEFHVVRPGPDLTGEWVLYFLLQPAVLRGAETHFAGTVGQQRVPENYLANLAIPLPPLPEQRRIVSILAGQMAAVERATAATETQLEAVRGLRAAILRDLFDGPRIKRWHQVLIKEVAKVQSGYAFKSEWFVPAGVRLLRNANVFPGRVSWDDVVCLPEERRHEFAAFELSVGNIILSLDRPLVNAGLKVARIDSPDVPSLLLQRVGRFICNAKVNDAFLYLFLNSPRFVRAISGHAQSLGVPHISPLQVEEVELPLPSLPEQRRLVDGVQKQVEQITGMLKALQGRKVVLESLPGTLLRKAFKEEL